MAKSKKTIRARRWFTPEFKADAVRLVLAGKSASQVAKEHDLTETALCEWVERAEADAGVPGVGRSPRAEPRPTQQKIFQQRLPILTDEEAPVATRCRPNAAI